MWFNLHFLYDLQVIARSERYTPLNSDYKFLSSPQKKNESRIDKINEMIHVANVDATT